MVSGVFFHLSAHLSTHLFTLPPIQPPIHPSTIPFILPSMHLFTHPLFHSSYHPSIHPLIHLSTILSIHASTHLPIHHRSIYLLSTFYVPSVEGTLRNKIWLLLSGSSPSMWGQGADMQTSAYNNVTHILMGKDRGWQEPRRSLTLL